MRSGRPKRAPLRILFVSSDPHGNTDPNQRDLCNALGAAGAETMMLADNATGSILTRFLHEQLRGASARFAHTPVLGDSASWLRSLPGRRASRSGKSVLVTPAPENALPDIAVSFCPDIVIGSQIARTAWAAVRATCDSMDIPTAIYLRDEGSLKHLTPRRGETLRSDDLVLADSRALTKMASAFRVRANYLAPLVDLEAARIDSTRERILVMDPRKQRGLGWVEDLAEHFRTIEFVLQEATPLTVAEQRHIDLLLARHPNVCFRTRPDSPAQMYRDAAIVLAPFRIDHSPRTVLEALCNGIPVIANDLPALSEAVGPGGCVASTRHQWFDEVNRLWQDPNAYRNVQAAAFTHAARDEVQADNIVSDLLRYVQAAMVNRQNRILDIGD